MSHYAVMVLTDGRKDVDELLAPYDENINIAPYIGRTREQMIADAKRNLEEIKKNLADGRKVGDWAKKYLAAKTDEDFYQCERYDDQEYDSDGNELSTYNPDSKWDWYQVGGRWSCAFDAYGVDPSGTRVGDIETFYDQASYTEAVRFWELYVEKQKPANEEEEKMIKFVFYRDQYYIDRYGDKETYAKCQAQLSTFAVVTPDGVWHEPGRMGWWGMSGETNEDGLDWELNFVDRFLKTADPDWELTIVDCHI